MALFTLVRGFGAVLFAAPRFLRQDSASASVKARLATSIRRSFGHLSGPSCLRSKGWGADRIGQPCPLALDTVGGGQ